MNKAFILLALIMSTSIAFANPGQYQINQACINVGCFSGDNPATSTIEITQAAGTFVLTSNLIISNNENGVPAISVSSASNDSAVVIDLNGYTISHTGIASAGTDGIEVAGINSVVTVRNGMISGFQDGIHSAEGATLVVEDMVFRINRDDAIQLNRGYIRDNVFQSNAYGIYVLLGPNGAGNEQLGERVFIDSNLFLDADGSQDALNSVSDTSYCKDNVIAYLDTGNLGACSLSGQNLCDSSPCTVNRSFDAVKD
ncbi:MAG: hypothetical protein DHS20C09_22580 [marine bacterium B5-7]|nr:MAG: hypothetical protein DHS20C09_22580 [marine bacterium B5-7]